MTYIYVTPEELATLALSSGAGSLGLSAAIFVYNAQPGHGVTITFGFLIAIAMVAYLLFGGLLVRIRRRSDLTWWNIFGE